MSTEANGSAQAETGAVERSTEAAAAPVNGAAPEGQEQQGQEQQPGAEQNAQPTEGQPEGESRKETPPHRKASYRFSELTREAKLREEAAYWRGIAEARGQAPPQPQRQEQQADPRDTAPDPNDRTKYPGGELDTNYLLDAAEHRAVQRIRAEQRQAEEARQRSEREAQEQRAMAEGQARYTEARRLAEEHDDQAGEAIATRGLDMLNRTGDRNLVDAVCKSPYADLIAAGLARNPDQIRRLADMAPMDRVWQVATWNAQYDAYFQAQRQAQQAQPAKPAPSPSPAQTPVVKGNGAAPQFNPEKASFADFQAYARQVWERGPSGSA